MEWLIYSLVSAIFRSVPSLIDKFALSKRHQDIHAFMIFIGFISFLSLIVAYIINGLKIVSIDVLIVCFILATTTTVGGWFYFKAIASWHVSSSVSILTGAIPLSSIVLAYIFLGELLSSNNLIGVFLIIVGIFIISYKKDISLINKKGLFFSLLTSFMVSTEVIFISFILENASYWDVFSWTRIFQIIIAFGLLFHYSYTKGRKELFSKIRPIAIPIATSETLSLIGKFLLIISLTFNLASLVATVVSTSILFTFLWVSILGIKIKFLKEELSNIEKFLKLIAIIIMISGVYFTSI